jgi:hypothetical protein
MILGVLALAIIVLSLGLVFYGLLQNWAEFVLEGASKNRLCI